MPKHIHAIPNYRKHKATGQAVVTVAGRDIYLGKHNSAASRQEYNRIIAEWIAHSGTLPQRQANDLLRSARPMSGVLVVHNGSWAV
jgi:hypothetical protein